MSAEPTEHFLKPETHSRTKPMLGAFDSAPIAGVPACAEDPAP